MKYRLESEGDFDVLRLSGEVDLQYSPVVREQILRGLGAGRDLLVDLGEVSYIDSSGIASLVEGLQTARERQLRFGLLNVSEATAQVLSLTRLDQVFATYHDAAAFRADDRS